MDWALAIVAATLFVAYANGANDNFKGVATLYGSAFTNYKKALLWATGTTLAGSITAIFLATKLVKTFSGKGLVSEAVAGTPTFLLAVILGAALTVFVATKTGLPTSTTHSLTGALVGGGLVAVGSRLGFDTMGNDFLIPLVASPLIAILLTLTLYPLFHKIRSVVGITKDTCVCIGEKLIPLQDCLSAALPPPAVWRAGAGRQGQAGLVQPPSAAVLAMTSLRAPVGCEAIPGLRSLDILIGENEMCQAKAIEVYSGKFFGLDVRRILAAFHFLSAGCVSFARGLNDTPKIVALALATGFLGLQWNVWLVGLAMALGGLLSARRVAETISHRVTAMNDGQGFTANLVTALLVIFSSQWGLPVSTTHVSCGSLFGIGLANGKAHWTMIGIIVSAWVLTLPVAALLSAMLYFTLRSWT